MLEWAADNYLNKYPIRYIVSREHQEQYNSAKIIKDCFGNRQDVTVTVLDNATNGPAETVYWQLGHRQYCYYCAGLRQPI
jgi:hypothetical protein